MRHGLTKRALPALCFIAILAAPTALVAAQGVLDVCLPVCSIPSTANGYATPATVLVSGRTLEWTSADGQYHTATSADYALDARIFEVGEGDGPGIATFEIRDDALWVLTQDEDPAFEPAFSAIDIGGGAFMLQYQCLFHTRFQKGAVVVVPAAT